MTPDRRNVDPGSGALVVPAAKPPTAVRVAVALLVLLVEEDVAVLAVAQFLPILGVDNDVLGVLARGVVCVAGARALQRGSRSGRSLLLLWALASLTLGIVFAVVEQSGPWQAADTFARGAALVALVVVLALPSTRQWCQARSETEEAVHGPTEHRRRARDHLPWYRRAVQAMRDDRDARR